MQLRVGVGVDVSRADSVCAPKIARRSVSATRGRSVFCASPWRLHWLCLAPQFPPLLASRLIIAHRYQSPLPCSPPSHQTDPSPLHKSNTTRNTSLEKCNTRESVAPATTNYNRRVWRCGCVVECISNVPLFRSCAPFLICISFTVRLKVEISWIIVYINIFTILHCSVNFLSARQTRK